MRNMYAPICFVNWGYKNVEMQYILELIACDPKYIEWTTLTSLYQSLWNKSIGLERVKARKAA